MRGGIKKWRVEYNRERPHSSLGNLAPEEFAAKNQMSLGRRAHRLATSRPELAGVAQRARASDPKLDSFSTTLGSV